VYASSRCITVATSQYVINKLFPELETRSSNTENGQYKASNADDNESELKLNAIKALESNRRITQLRHAKHSMLQYTLYKPHLGRPLVAIPCWYLPHSLRPRRAILNGRRPFRDNLSVFDFTWFLKRQRMHFIWGRSTLRINFCV